MSAGEVNDARTVTFELSGIAACPYSIAADYVQDNLLRFNGSASELVLLLPYALVFGPLRGGLRREVHLDVTVVHDLDNASRSHEALEFDWQVQSRFFPLLRGVLSFALRTSSGRG